MQLLYYIKTLILVMPIYKNKIAIFCFEASLKIGAGHAMRACVLADALIAKGWICKVVTSEETYKFISSLERFERVEPNEFYDAPIKCSLLVIDNYDLGFEYETHFRPYAEKILVIDDLANRKHDCDILLDQTLGRDANDYKSLVPKQCKILVSYNYILIRNELVEMRPRSLEKRRNTTGINRILVSMGGSDPKNHTITALEMIKKSGFKGTIDVVLGFASEHMGSVKTFVETLANDVKIHSKADMARLLYQADIALGAAGGSVWERCCLGLPQVLILTADNQKSNFQTLEKLGISSSLKNLIVNLHNYNQRQKFNIDGFGVNRVIKELDSDGGPKRVTFREVAYNDIDLIYSWQQIKEVRKYFNNPNPPSLSEHKQWFSKRITHYENPYWIICFDHQDCGVISLTYNYDKESYELSWFILPEVRGKGIGTEALQLAVDTIYPLRIYAFVKEHNFDSHKSLIKTGFLKLKEGYYSSGGNDA